MHKTVRGISQRLFWGWSVTLNAPVRSLAYRGPRSGGWVRRTSCETTAFAAITHSLTRSPEHFRTSLRPTPFQASGSLADDVSRIIRSESKRQRHGGESKGDDGERSCEPMSIIDALMDDEGGEEEEGPWGGLSEHEYMEVLQALEESIRRDMESEGACVAVGWFWLILCRGRAASWTRGGPGVVAEATADSAKPCCHLVMTCS